MPGVGPIHGNPHLRRKEGHSQGLQRIAEDPVIPWLFFWILTGPPGPGDPGPGPDGGAPGVLGPPLTRSKQGILEANGPRDDYLETVQSKIKAPAADQESGACHRGASASLSANATDS